jgi:predicted ATPase/transcriptional regulator with XRE-family HTH domain
MGAGPNRCALRVPDHGSSRSGGANRSGPTGGCAYGIPRNATTPFSTAPFSVPKLVLAMVVVVNVMGDSFSNASERSADPYGLTHTRATLWPHGWHTSGDRVRWRLGASGQMKGVTAFGESLREHRLARLMTQAELAERAGLSERAISDLERGLKTPQPATIRLLIDALDLAPARAEGFGLVARLRPSSPEVAPGKHNLPTALTSLVGREEALARLEYLLDPRQTHSPPVHLVTLTGPGGCGKTRLATEVARRPTCVFSDGIWFADLSTISDATLVPTVVLAAMGGRESTDELPVDSLWRHLGGRTLLLVLDNCEHVINACARLLDTLLGACPNLRVLATSREALRVPGEVVWRVPSLTLPELGDGAAAEVPVASEAVRLFVDRVRQLEQDFSLTDSNSAAAAEICRRLDGIPLAIELAAACTSGLTVQEIAARLDNRFDLLTGGHRTVLMRHRTLRATIDWSHDLLSPAEQTLLRRLATFAGGWTLEGAENVCSADELDRSEILHLLMRLVDQSLVNADFDADAGHTRYRLLQTVRAYAAERLQAAGETADVQARHRAWYLEFAERAAVGMKGPDQPNWLRLVTAEQDNIRAALDSYELDPTAAAFHLRLAAAMGRFWFPFHPDEGPRRLAAALERASATPCVAHAAALSLLAQFELLRADPSIGRDMARAALSEARALGDAGVQSEALIALALATDDEETTARAAMLEEGLAAARAADDTGLVARHLGLLAAAAAETGDFARARMLLDEAGSVMGRGARQGDWMVSCIAQLGWLAVAEHRLDDAESHFKTLLDLGARLGNPHYSPAVLGLGVVYLRRGDTQRARVLYRRLLSNHWETSPDSALAANTLAYLAAVEAADGLHERAHRLLGASEAWHAARGTAGRRWWPNLRGPLLRGLVPVPPAPLDPLLIRAREDGRLMSLDGAVAYALEK